MQDSRVFPARWILIGQFRHASRMQGNFCIPASDTNLTRQKRRAGAGTRDFYLSWHFLFIFQCKVVLGMVFRALIEGNLHQQETLVITFYLFYLQHILPRF